MADSTFEVLEIRFRFPPHATECSVLCGPPSDGMLGVQGWHTKVFLLGVRGWHTKVFPPEISAMKILETEFSGLKFLTGDGWRQGE